ncbi:ATP synthase subunit C lysine N-methyltransferase isoform X3 [Neoarius graeffei]|uniref:ATP synthase subunit C lysine N-methyltransferase isoform X3 n=1 Tax=Neoarius graeffei TaxID=443677 RepID=UPI00298C32F6|nr:ATP synthase subunit C lysine N-methyltransferase isoform X3 [Neoarius graeffei]
MCDSGAEGLKGAAEGETSTTSTSSVKQRVGFIATCALGGSLLALYSVAGPFVAPALRKICLPFVPATNTQVKNILRALQSRSGTLADIGSGDGRIVSFSQYSNVVIFGVPQMPQMEQLEAKLQAELQSSARVVACRFPFPTWTPDHVTGEGIDTVWVYDAKTFKSHKTTEKLLNNTDDKINPS